MEFITGLKSPKEPSAMQESVTDKTKGVNKRRNKWYSNCICLADILDSDHDLSRKGEEKNPLETYLLTQWKLNEPPDPIWKAYQTIFNKEIRTQTRIHKMFEELIEKFGPNFQNIDGDNIPRLGLTKGKIVSKKDLSSQRTAIYEDSIKSLEDLMVETHRGGTYEDNTNRVLLYKAKSSTIFDLGSNAGFKDFSDLKVEFSNNYFPNSNTDMISYTEEAFRTLYLTPQWKAFMEKSDPKWSNVKVNNKILLVHTFQGKEGPTYSIQFGPVTADEVTYELYGENRRSCFFNKENKVKNMIISIDGQLNDDDDIARKCHIVYGKTCGDGVSIDAAEQMGCGVLSNDICCCYRAAIVNGFGFRPCPTAAKFFSNERVVEVFQTKPKGIFDKIKAQTLVGNLLESLNNFDTEKNKRIEHVNNILIDKKDNKNITALSVCFNMKKEKVIESIRAKTIPNDLAELLTDLTKPIDDENILKRYCYYDMDQCIGSLEFYTKELTQFIVDIKSNNEILSKIRLTPRSSYAEQIYCFEQCLLIIANIELVFSSFMTDEDIVPFSKSFFRNNLNKMYGSNFLKRFKETLEAIIAKDNSPPQNLSTLLQYIVNYESSSSSSSIQTQKGGAPGNIVLLKSVYVPLPYLYSDLEYSVRFNYNTKFKLTEAETHSIVGEMFKETPTNANYKKNNYEYLFERITDNDVTISRTASQGPLRILTSFSKQNNNFNFVGQNVSGRNSTDIFGRMKSINKPYKAKSASKSRVSKRINQTKRKSSTTTSSSSDESRKRRRQSDEEDEMPIISKRQSYTQTRRMMNLTKKKLKTNTP